VKDWTQQEIETLKARYYEGVSVRRIGAELGRTYWSVENKLSHEIEGGAIISRCGMVWRAKQLLMSGYGVEQVADMIECPLPLAVVALHELPEAAAVRLAA
jgi:hypothetical protein